jgi:hypothetical protein
MRWTIASWIARFSVLVADPHGDPLHAPGEKASYQMRNRSYKGAVIFFAGLLLVSSGWAQEQAAAPPADDAIAKKMDAMEQELKELRAEVAAMKAPASAAPAEAPAATAGNAVVNTAPAAAAPAGPSLSGLLGNTTLSGFVDTYYGYNANQPATRQTGLRNFDINSGQFGLNMIELVADKSVDPTHRVGYHVALGFGQAMNLVNSSEVGPGAIPGTSVSNFDQYLKEGYLEYMAPVGKGLQINIGKFVTPAGAEVIESKDDWNYSRGLLFSWAIPYFHFGVSAKYAFSPKFAVTGFLVNGWNNSIDNNTGKTGGFSAAWTPNAKFSIIENYLTGPEHQNYNGAFRNLSDTVITYNPTAKLSLMANYDYSHDHFVTSDEFGVPPFTVGPRAVWSGLAGFVKYAPNDKYALSLRGEFFDDNQGASTGTAQNLSEFTATFQRMISKSIISRVEFRRDMSGAAVFLKGDSEAVKTQNTLTVGVIYAFSSADAK